MPHVSHALNSDAFSLKNVFSFKCPRNCTEYISFNCHETLNVTRLPACLFSFETNANADILCTLASCQSMAYTSEYSSHRCERVRSLNAEYRAWTIHNCLINRILFKTNFRYFEEMLADKTKILTVISLISMPIIMPLIKRHFSQTYNVFVLVMYFVFVSFLGFSKINRHIL